MYMITEQADSMHCCLLTLLLLMVHSIMRHVAVATGENLEVSNACVLHGCLTDVYKHVVCALYKRTAFIVACQ
jgi:hypothetical protein